MAELEALPSAAGNGSQLPDTRLFGPDALTAAEAERLLERAPGQLTVFLGETGAGKTTICTELYERQRRGATSVRFAGSWTLLAFEVRARVRRLTGRALPAAMSGVDPEGAEILHLALSADRSPLHLLLADYPGELFRRLADNQIDAEQLPWLRRADRIVLMVDGALLCDVDARSTALTRARQLLERLRAVEPARDVRAALLVSKWDRVLADRAAADYWQAREEEMLADLRAVDAGAPAIRCDYAAGGVDELAAWLLDLPAPPSRRPVALAAPAEPPQPAPAQPPPAEAPTAPEQAAARERDGEGESVSASVEPPAFAPPPQFEWPAGERVSRWRFWRRGR